MWESSLLIIYNYYNNDSGAVAKVTNNKSSDPSFALTDVADLLKKQSVRATFKVSPEFIQMFRSLAAVLQIKQKSLFDLLLEDEQSLHAVAKTIKPDRLAKDGRIQKAYSVSKKSLLLLEAVSKRFGISRDDLLEGSIRRLLPIIAKERARQDKRERAYAMLGAHLDQTTELLNNVKRLVGKDDPIFESIQAVVSAIQNACIDIEKWVAKGRRITELPMEKYQE
jgi:hypothetical protein